VLLDDTGVGQRVVELLRERGEQVTCVHAGPAFQQLDGQRFCLDPASPGDYARLFAALRERGALPEAVLHAFALREMDAGQPPEQEFEEAQSFGFFSLMALAQELGRQAAEAVELVVVANGLCDVTGEEPLAPGRATLLGPCRVVRHEHPRIACRSVDVVLPEAADGRERLARQLAQELQADGVRADVAYRGANRLALAYERVELPSETAAAATLRPRGTYLLTGGLGKIGLALADQLARACQARLVLVGRSPFPPREEWDAHAAAAAPDARVAATIARLRALEALGAEVEVAQADVADVAQLERVVARAVERFGPIHGVVHGAGPLFAEAFGPLQDATPAACRQLFRAKAHGVLALERALASQPLDFAILQSSLAAALGGLGFAAYAASNLYLDAFAQRRARGSARPELVWRSMQWDGWVFEEDRALAGVDARVHALAILPEEGSALALRLLGDRTSATVAVSTVPLQARLELWQRPRAENAPAVAAAASHARPELAHEYEEPVGEIEAHVARLWEELLGVAPVGRRDHFLELGGHSLLATQFLSRLRDAYGVELPLRLIYERASVADFAGAIVKTRAEAADAVELAELVAELEGLSDEQVAALLERERSQVGADE
jgi:NAD(P)-dependent dehydrogenase (short-subunit alcohol dehydrogenase family)